PGETVSWTQRMTNSGGTIQYSIPTLTSATWGSLGSDAILASFPGSGCSGLSSYTPASSASNSGGSWKINGLKSLTLAKVRYYWGNSLLLTDSTPRQVDCTKPFQKP